MKKFKWALLAVLFILSPLSAGGFDDKGLLSNWCFFPLQVDAGLMESRKLVDEQTHTLFSLGLLILEQKSAIFSVALLANRLQNNYGIQLPLFLGSVTDNNYGISFGWDNFSKKCYGIQLGVLNHCFAGEKIEPQHERWQFLGMNIADRVYLGVVNISDKLQIGLFNLSPGNAFQIGLLNYNARSFIPWCPVINFDMGNKTKPSAKEDGQKKETSKR